MPHWGIYFRKRWEDCFVSHLNQAEKEAIYLYKYGYLWHVFSYEKQACLQKMDANEAFDAVKKTTCYIFYQHSSDVLLVERAAALKAVDFADEQDVYIVDEDFTWTYVVTHEGYCGPYFSAIM
ncbi:MAG: DUF4275 family protein [Solibacillus sp.]